MPKTKKSGDLGSVPVNARNSKCEIRREEANERLQNMLNTLLFTYSQCFENDTLKGPRKTHDTMKMSPPGTEVLLRMLVWP